MSDNPSAVYTHNASYDYASTNSACGTVTAVTTISLSDGANYSQYISYDSSNSNFVINVANRPPISSRTTTLSITVKYNDYPSTSITATMYLLEVDCKISLPSVADIVVFANDPALASVTKTYKNFAQALYNPPSECLGSETFMYSDTSTQITTSTSPLKF